MRRANDKKACGSLTTIAAFLFGLPVGVGLVLLLTEGPWQDPLVQRYLSHPVERVELVAFCCALGAILGKFLGARREADALRRELLPPWGGQSVSVDQAGVMAADLDRHPAAVRDTLVGRRLAAILGFVHSRGSANELDDQLRTLADNDAMAQESSYSLLRFICWAIPILGFLGTVLGITQAIAGVTPDKLEQNLNLVTDGLALAFDTTALALFLTMILMFGMFAVERIEQGLLARVDVYVEDQLAHRFERTGSESGQFVEALRRNTQVFLQATEQLVEKQASLWANTAKDQQERLASAMTQALESTLARHTRHLTQLEDSLLKRNQALVDALGHIAANLEQHAGSLTNLHAGEAEILRLQETLQQNLNTLASTGTFEEAVQSLTAAIHLLTSRAAGTTSLRAAKPNAA